MVMIYINLVEVHCLILHAMFEIKGLLVLKKNMFFKGFAIYSHHGGHLSHVTWTIYTRFRSPFLKMLHMKFGFD